MTTHDLTAQLAADLHKLHAAGKLASPWLEGMRLVVLPDDGTMPAWLNEDDRDTLAEMAEAMAAMNAELPFTASYDPPHA